MKTTPEKLAELKSRVDVDLGFGDGLIIKHLIADLEGLQARLYLRNEFCSRAESRLEESQVTLDGQWLELEDQQKYILQLEGMLREAQAKIVQLEIAAVNRSVSNQEASALFALGAERELTAELQAKLAAAEKDAARWKELTTPEGNFAIAVWSYNGEWRIVSDNTGVGLIDAAIAAQEAHRHE